MNNNTEKYKDYAGYEFVLRDKKLQFYQYTFVIVCLAFWLLYW
jgi:hypothetical protein